MLKKITGNRWLNLALGIIFLAFMIFPIYWMVNVSLQPNGAIIAASPFPFNPDLAGFERAWEDQKLNLLTSLIIAVGAVIVCLIIATPAAYALACFKLPGAGAATLAILISQMIPGIVIANAIYSAYNDLGLLDSIPGLILADASLGIPFSILIIRAFVQSIPSSIIEAAYVDGASRFRAFISIVVPVSRNAIITGALFTFLFAWSDFLFALTLTTGNEVRPITLGIYRYLSGYVNNWSPVMASAVLASIPAIILLIAAQRFVAAGVTGGATKA
jgi:multiple sugar transport system permease protein